MAVANCYWFEYDVTFSLDADGILQGTAVSLQAQRGWLPGLAGLRPTVTAIGDALRVESNPAEKPPAKAWDWITAFIPFAHNRYITRRLRAAQVQSFELQLPGLTRCIKPGCTANLVQIYAPLPNQPFSAERQCEVLLRQNGEEVNRWVSPEFSSQEW